MSSYLTFDTCLTGALVYCFIIKIIFAAMVVDAISYGVPACPSSSHTGVDLSTFPNILDGTFDTCGDISGSGITYIELKWRFPTHKFGLNRFRVVLSGTQSCSDSNTVWFVVASGAPVILAECEVSQNTTSGLKGCLITCTCPYAECEYLYFRVQMPAWMRRTLAICHFELLNQYDTVELPFVIVWISNQWFPFHFPYTMCILYHSFPDGNILPMMKRYLNTAN